MGCPPHSRTLGDKASVYNARDLGLIPGLGRSPGEGKGYPFQYSGLENSKDCIVLGVAKSWSRLSDFHFHVYLEFIYLPWAVLGLGCGMQGDLLWHVGSSWRPAGFSLVEAHRLSSYRTGLSCPAECGIFISPPGMEPSPPALQGGFLTAGPPKKSHRFFF